ncbi:universal stress protein [Flammeovirgaceae bacterium SG7u.111]|nr:universal stress protein [Flammeovirgaceae bacterium SG7u.132]WPO33942.1 universal stress protein [Flammeovirgaceae bacterium SG7u.111]
MSTLNKILVPTDFSEEANNALEVAVEIARFCNADITLLHIVDVPSIGSHSVTGDAINMNISGGDAGGDPMIYKGYMSRLVSITKQKISEIKEKYDDVNLKEHIVFDNMQKHLAQFVVKDKTDLIIMGSKGSSGINEILVGSNTERVIRTSKIPVMTIKSQVEEFYPKNIVFASNFIDVSDEAIDNLKLFQKLFSSTLHFVKIVTPNNFETTPDTEVLIESFAQENEFDDYTVNVFNYYTEEEGIRAFGHTLNADLLSLTTHGRKGISHLLFGSIAEEVVNHAIKPVLTFNEQH